MSVDPNFLNSTDTDDLSRLESWTLQLYSIQHFDEAIKVFSAEIYEGLQCRSVIFFKYLKSFSSILATHSEGIAFSEIRGQGLNFSEDKNFSPIRDFLRIKENPSFQTIMSKILPHHDYVISLCVVKGEVKGLFVYIDIELKSLERPYYKLAERVLSHWLSEIILLEQNHNLNRTEELTDLLNRRVFIDYLALEVGRAQRIKHPVSLILVRIDNLQHLKSKLNLDRYHTLIKMVSKILLQSTRKTDYVGSLSEDEFGLLLPHMSLKNARNKSKLIKNTLESSKYFSDTNLSLDVHFSICVSEYPLLAHDFEDLLLACSQKLMIEPHMGQIIEVVKNGSFQPDFKYTEAEPQK